jgi:sugar phosphate isomerase/epimerase
MTSSPSRGQACAIGNRPGYGLNVDPSHFIWQDFGLVAFLDTYAERIYHVDCKESVRHLDGCNGRLASHLPFGDLHRGWDFVSVGHGEVRWEHIFNEIGYAGPISVEWEDSVWTARPARPKPWPISARLNFQPPSFDAAFASG